MRMTAYHYAFVPTGVDEIDKILSAVACAGKAFHNTEQWIEEAGQWEPHTGETPVAWIQNAANEAAAAMRKSKKGS